MKPKMSQILIFTSICSEEFLEDFCFPATSILLDSVIMDIVENISPEDMESIAIQCMGIKHPEIQTIKSAERENINIVKFRIVEMWRNRNPVPDVNWRLYKILTESGRVSTEACLPIVAQSKNIHTQGSLGHSNFYRCVSQGKTYQSVKKKNNPIKIMF